MKLSVEKWFDLNFVLVAENKKEKKKKKAICCQWHKK